MLAVGAAMFWSLRLREHESLPFLLALALFGLSFVGLGICMWPYIVPTEITVWEAAAPRKSQAFMLVGASFLIPIIRPTRPIPTGCSAGRSTRKAVPLMRRPLGRRLAWFVTLWLAGVAAAARVAYAIRWWLAA